MRANVTYDDFVKEFIPESDRAAVVLGAAYIEELLGELLAASIIGLSAAASKELLKRDLQGYERRAKIAHAFGLISNEELADIKDVGTIRNKMAHVTAGYDFSEKMVVGLCGQFRVARFHFGAAARGPKWTPRHQFDAAVALLCISLLHRIQLASSATAPGQPFL